ncbi:MAG: 3-deoxy-7-phosphoheptulonate synthase, partial [Clostridia bacterium]|nr:3-deoxy-7-phosphoheptulonate synthase [Clostridia bacterium]
MVIIMSHDSSSAEIEAVVKRLEKEGFAAHVSSGASRTVIGVIGENTKERLPALALEAMPGVEKVVPVLRPYRLAGRELHPEDSLIRVRDYTIGGR